MTIDVTNVQGLCVDHVIIEVQKLASNHTIVVELGTFMFIFFSADQYLILSQGG